MEKVESFRGEKSVKGKKTFRGAKPSCIPDENEEKYNLKNKNVIADLFDSAAQKILPKRSVIYLIYGIAAVYTMDLLLNFAGITWFASALSFIRGEIFRGQVWRILTFPFVSGFPATPYTLFSFLLNILLLYVASGMLLAKLGTKKTNGFLLMLWFLLTVWGFISGFASFSTAIWGIVILAALYSPEFQINLYFVLPVKGTLIAILSSLYLLWRGISGDISALIVLLAVLVYSWERIAEYLGMKQRSNEYKTKIKDARVVRKYRHKCSVCGVTEVDKPDMLFRFCSQCNGNFEYCEDHIKNHEHRTSVIDISTKMNKNQ